jgi:hypothetical protein
MALTCEIKSTYLEKPESGLDNYAGAETEPPFTLKGAPLTLRPESITNISEFVRKPTATKDISNPQVYFGEENYYQVDLNTENIIGSDENTTLRFNGQNFTQQFIAIHKNIWNGKAAQLSVLLKSQRGQIFHFCIPIEYSDSSENENLYLKYWLYNNPSGLMRNGLTVNELLNFRKDKVNFTLLQYCLQFNKGESYQPYILCLFKDALQINKNELPSWLKNDLYLNQKYSIPNEKEKTKYRRTTFDQIFNLMMRGTINTYVMNMKDPFLVSSDIYFNSKQTQNEIRPSYYTVDNKTISGTKVKEGFEVIESFTTRQLKGVKCYPINLATQVDSNGDIIVDEDNVPVDINVINGNDTKTLNSMPNASSTSTTTTNLKYNAAYILSIIIFGILAIIVCIYIVLKLMAGRQSGANIGSVSSPISSSIGT